MVRAVCAVLLPPDSASRVPASLQCAPPNPCRKSYSAATKRKYQECMYVYSSSFQDQKRSKFHEELRRRHYYDALNKQALARGGSAHTHLQTTLFAMLDGHVICRNSISCTHAVILRARLNNWRVCLLRHCLLLHVFGSLFVVCQPVTAVGCTGIYF